MLTLAFLRKRLRYLGAKAKLARILSELPLGALIFTLGVGIFAVAESGLTPYSVSVSGYVRQDGTEVGSYSRRPPGSRQHDEPIEYARILGFALIAWGGFRIARVLYRFGFKPDYELLPPLDKDAIARAIQGSGLPERPPTVRVPNRIANARKVWLCSRCQQPIERGARYWYYEAARYHATRYRFCSRCRGALISERTANRLLEEAYQRAYPSYVTALRREKRTQFKTVYGHDCVSLPDSILGLPRP